MLFKTLQINYFVLFFLTPTKRFREDKKKIFNIFYIFFISLFRTDLYQIIRNLTLTLKHTNYNISHYANNGFF